MNYFFNVYLPLPLAAAEVLVSVGNTDTFASYVNPHKEMILEYTFPPININLYFCIHFCINCIFYRQYKFNMRTSRMYGVRNFNATFRKETQYDCTHFAFHRGLVVVPLRIDSNSALLSFSIVWTLWRFTGGSGKYNMYNCAYI